MAIDDIPRNKYGFPIRKPTKIAHSRFSEGGKVANKDVEAGLAALRRKEAGIKDVEGPSIMDSVGSVLTNYKNKILGSKPTADKGSTVDQIKSYNQRQADAIKDVDAPASAVADTDTNEQAKRKGGRIKSKPRGVGKALRGHGKAMKHGSR